MEFAARQDDSEISGEASRQLREREAPLSSASADAVETLFRTCEVRLGRFLAQMVGNRALAEDLLQDSFSEAFRCRDQLGEIASPEAWLFGIARNRALVALRRRRRFRMLSSVSSSGPSRASTTISNCSLCAICLNASSSRTIAPF